MARHVFELDPSNVRACRVLAEVAEKAEQPIAIEWRKKVTTLVPDSIDDSVALAKTALRFNEITMAEKALGDIAARAQSSAPYHEVRAELAAAKKDQLTAEKEFAEAVKLDSSNKSYQLNLAVCQLKSTAPNVRSSGSATLRQFLSDKDFRAPAARALRDDLAERKDVTGLLEISQILFDYPEATFRDRLFHAQLLHALDRKEFAGILSGLQNEAVNDSNKLPELLSWMSANQLTLLALHWIKTLPDNVLNKRPVRLAVADCYGATNDWDGLKQWCKKAQWGDLEFLRHVYLARALRELGDDSGFQAEWRTALQNAGNDGDRLHTMQQGAAKWGWNREAEELLWLLSKDFQKQQGALAALYQYYVEKGDTGNLYRVVSRLCEIKSDDNRAQNNLAQLALLLNINLDRANEVAERVYRAEPNNPVFASTYAFSLYRKGRPSQAVQIMDKLTSADLEKPATAAYYGIFLSEAGDKTKAAQYLDRGFQASLLPEERALLQNARDKIGQ